MAVVSQKMYETHHFTMFNVIVTINCEEVENQPVLIEELQSMIPKVFNGSLGPSFWILASHISLYVGLKKESGISHISLYFGLKRESGIILKK